MRALARLVPALALVAATPAAPPAPPRGFFPDSGVEQQKVEREFRALPDPAVARESMRALSAAPHHLGSPKGRDNAEWILSRF
jgi:N-acetylated-alpha-linked acidic dipeptidase